MRRTRYRLVVARTKAQEGDAIARVADAGENAVRQVVGFPRHLVDEVLDGVGKRLEGVATRLRALDPLTSRVTTIEKRLDSIEKAKKATARRASRRRTAAARPRPTTVAELAPPVAPPAPVAPVAPVTPPAPVAPPAPDFGLGSPTDDRPERPPGSD